MSWLQKTFRGLLLKNVAFNLTIQDIKFPKKIRYIEKIAIFCYSCIPLLKK